MIIISQDKKRITDNMNLRIEHIWIEGDGDEFHICGEKGSLGWYKTEERAKEVLGELAISGINEYVYEMPKE